MDFLNELKSRAQNVQSQKDDLAQVLPRNAEQTEVACTLVARYFRDLAKTLDVLEPAGPSFSLDGKTPWPAMKLTGFQTDARKTMLRGKEAFDTISMGWTIIPKMGMAVGGAVTVRVIPEAERIHQALMQAFVEHERKEQRNPQRNNLESITFDYLTKARGGVTVKPVHDTARLEFRLANTSGFAVTTVSLAATQITSARLDELAKLILAQSSQFA